MLGLGLVFRVMFCSAQRSSVRVRVSIQSNVLQCSEEQSSAGLQVGV